MEALVLILIGFIAGFELGGNRQTPNEIEPASVSPTARAIECVVEPDAIRIANLDDSAALIWIVQPDQSLCDPVTERIVIFRDRNIIRSF